MTYLAVFLALTTLFFWWRKRVWKRRFVALAGTHGQAIVNAFAQMWAEAYREQMRDQWPEEISDGVN